MIVADRIPFALPGDSGSLVVTEDGSAAVGLLFSSNSIGNLAYIPPPHSPCPEGPEVIARVGTLAMTDIGQAARNLIAHLDYPSWLSSVVVGWEDDRPAIILYLAAYPASPVKVLEDGSWEGHLVVS